jgi:hypothetical protein
MPGTENHVFDWLLRSEYLTLERRYHASPHIILSLATRNGAEKLDLSDGKGTLRFVLDLGFWVRNHQFINPAAAAARN